MMHTDLLDTVLLSQKESTTAAAASNMTDANPSAAAAAGAEAKCPVDHKTRETWLQEARSTSKSPVIPHGSGHRQSAAIASQPLPRSQAQASQPTESWLSWLRLPFTSNPQNQEQIPLPPTARACAAAYPALDESRVVSSIPRTAVPGPSSCPVPPTSPSTPSNHEQETGADPASGNWIYPSEKMFFDAMKRKGFDAASAADMKTVVPIHNAVNERAWAEILRWEAPYCAAADATCGGPRLHSFAGLSGRMTPRARINTLLGYTAPFDRHDWVVDRCGTRVEYVIDFYAGRGDGAGRGKLNFYLDVRPKLNTWEGVRMRAMRVAGLV